MCDNFDRILAASTLQLVVVLLCVLWFLYLRWALGERARYLAHLAAGWFTMGVMYGVHPAVCRYFAAINTNPGAEAQSLWRVVDSTLSLVSSSFLITVWYMMREVRQEKRRGVKDPMPTMSKDFLGKLIAALATVIGAYIALASSLLASWPLRVLFTGIDVVFAALAVSFVGWEFANIQLISDKEEGGLFRNPGRHSVFRKVTLVLFLLWGALQLGHLLSLSKQPLGTFQYPFGGFYNLLGALKVLCAATGGILAMHALPSERWQHKSIARPARASR